MKTVSTPKSTISLDNLLRIKAHILQSKQTRTYCQMFNNNPFCETERYEFYLNPDPGGPHSHPQWNINCDPQKGDFNTIIVRKKLSHFQSDEDFQDQYRRLSFGGREVRVVDDYDDVPSGDSGKLMRFPEDAIGELLKIIDNLPRRA